MAEIARICGVSRARISQIADFTLLAPTFVDRLLRPNSQDLLDLGTLRKVAAIIEWDHQREINPGQPGCSD